MYVLHVVRRRCVATAVIRINKSQQRLGHGAERGRRGASVRRLQGSRAAYMLRMLVNCLKMVFPASQVGFDGLAAATFCA